MCTVCLIIDREIVDEKEFKSVVDARELVKTILGNREYRTESIPLVDCYLTENFDLCIYRA